MNTEIRFHIARARTERSRAFYSLSRAVYAAATRRLVRVRGLLKRLGSRYAQWRQRQRDIAALAQLDRRTLSDIGIIPSNIGAAVTDRRTLGKAAFEPALDRDVVAVNDDNGPRNLRIAN